MLATLASRGLWLLMLLSGFVQASVLTGAWRPAQPGDTAAQVLTQARNGALTPFDPASLHTFPAERGAWVVLRPLAPVPAGPLTLSVRSPTMSRVTLYRDGRAWRSTAISDVPGETQAHGRLAFSLPGDWPATAPLVLKFEPSSALKSVVAFRLQPTPAYQQSDARWLSMASASFGVMLAMAFMALCFAVILRDLTFVWYAGYVISYVMVQAAQTGFLADPLGWRFLAENEPPVVAFSVAASVALAIVFMLSFCNVRRYAPRWRKPLFGLALAMLLLALLRCSGIPTLRDLMQESLNPLLVACALATLAAAITCAVRRSRAAWFFLAGWTPLLALTILTSLQVAGVLAGIDWLNDVLIVAGALESIVLSIGLAYRELDIRRERDHARVLADQDALTGLLNRRAWSDAAEQRIADTSIRPQTLLFLDLDHFKTLNDGYGHVAGDQALIALAQTLREELQPDDLPGRYGGEEFVALVGGMPMHAAMQLAKRLCRRVDALHIALDEAGTQLTASIGVACLHDDDNLASLLRRADAAMYLAKASGRNQVVSEAEVARRRRHASGLPT